MIGKSSNFKNLLNMKFGRLKVIKLSNKKSANRSCIWECKCSCGKITNVITYSLLSKRTRSCGCLRNKAAHNRNYLGQITGTIWSNILRGARQRGIKFFLTREEAWELFIKQKKRCALTNQRLRFRRYVKKQNGKDIYSTGTASLDRINSKLPYQKDNVQWVHKDINWLKNKFSQDKFINMCRLVYTNSRRNKNATKRMSK